MLEPEGVYVECHVNQTLSRYLYTLEPAPELQRFLDIDVSGNCELTAASYSPGTRPPPTVMLSDTMNTSRPFRGTSVPVPITFTAPNPRSTLPVTRISESSIVTWGFSRYEPATEKKLLISPCPINASNVPVSYTHLTLPTI